MWDEIEYASRAEERLAIRVLYITHSTARRPCFADADTLIVDPVRGKISVYGYSRSTHRLVDIPTVFKLTPSNLYKLLQRTLMLIVQYDPSSTDHVKIVDTIPFIMDSSLRLSIATRIGANHKSDSIGDVSSAASGVCEGYNCWFDVDDPEEAFAVNQVIIEACTLMSPISTDFADIYSVLHNASRCEISIATGPSADSAAQGAIDKLSSASSVTGAISVLVENHAPSLEEWTRSVRVIESGLGSKAQLVPAMQYDERATDSYKYVLIATYHSTQ